MRASPRRLARLVLAASLLIGAGPAPSAHAAPSGAADSLAIADIPGQVLRAPSRRTRERQALRALLADRHVAQAELQARLDAAPAAEQGALQAALEQHKRATRLALIDRQLVTARARGDQAKTLRLEQRRGRWAAGVKDPLPVDAPSEDKPASEVPR